MSNKDLATKLKAMRVKAKESASLTPPAPVPPLQPTQESKPDKKQLELKEPEAPKLKVVPTRKAFKEGRGGAKVLPIPELERTTITLKPGDNEALSELQTFLMRRVRKAASTSTLIRLSLLYTKQALSSNAEALAKLYGQVLEDDGRKKSANV